MCGTYEIKICFPFAKHPVGYAGPDGLVFRFATRLSDNECESADFLFFLNILHFLTRNHLFDGSNHQIRLVKHDGMTAPGGDEVCAIG